MRFQSPTRFLSALAAILLPVGSIHAANILFVDTAAVHPSWSTLITGAGHTYTLFDTGAHNVNLSAQSAKDYVNSFDVVVVSGSNAAFNSLRAHGANWNAIETPMINLGNFLISGQFSSASWRWTTPGNGTTPNLSGATDNSLDVLVPSDPIWDGITLTPGSPVTSPDFFTANVGVLALGVNTLLPGIAALATRTGTPGTIAVAYAAPDALAAGGGARYFIPGMTGSNGQAVPYTAAGEQLFLNAISAFVIPEPRSVMLLGLGGLLLAVRRRRA